MKLNSKRSPTIQADLLNFKMAEEQAAPLVEIPEEDREKVMRFARYSAHTLDKLCGSILELTKRLEDANMIPKDRKTKALVKKQMTKHKSELQVDEKLVADVLKQLQANGNPSPEAVVSTLFRDLDMPRVKRIIGKSKQAEEADEQ